ncbi:MAG: aminotransferase class I/II-fold pyridoxal phosphate-dependent enzyme [Candidatus Aureabacteria bacterium]|nr:aminotransferase class I/II-fold pyridoxal phosphate-dependent enzyme [Candidatus Auribacterota bacterium]
MNRKIKKAYPLPKLSSVAEQMPPSGIRLFFDLVLTMDDVISLGVGEPDFNTPWHISQYAIEKIETGFTTYTSNSGLMELREAITDNVRKTYGLSYDPVREILITVGVSEAYDLALRALINPGDEILVHEPCYVSYKPLISLAGGSPRVVSTRKENGFKVLPKDLASNCSRRSKAFVFNYPCNPTGVTYSKKELEALASVIREKNLFVISDEIYHHLSFDHPHISFPILDGFKERCLYLNGFSKGYAMTGWRIGFACGPSPLIALMTKIHQYTMLCASVMGQYAAIEALKNGSEDTVEMKNEYFRRRNYIVKKLNDIGLSCHVPGGAFYVFPEIPACFSSDLEFANQLLKEERVAVVPGSAFGRDCSRHIRISYAYSVDKLKAASERIERFIKRHQG